MDGYAIGVGDWSWSAVAHRAQHLAGAVLEAAERQLEENERARLQRQHLEGERVSEFRRGEPHWIWRASWPASTELFASARNFLAGTPHEKILSDNFQKLSVGGRPKTPQDFALLLEAQGVPSDLTLELLVEHKLALKGFRPR